VFRAPVPVFRSALCFFKHLRLPSHCCRLPWAGGMRGYLRFSACHQMQLAPGRTRPGFLPDLLLPALVAGWRGRAGSGEPHGSVVTRPAGPRPRFVAESSVCCMTFLPFPCFPCPFDRALVRNTCPEWDPVGGRSKDQNPPAQPNNSIPPVLPFSYKRKGGTHRIILCSQRALSREVYPDSKRPQSVMWSPFQYRGSAGGLKTPFKAGLHSGSSIRLRRRLPVLPLPALVAGWRGRAGSGERQKRPPAVFLEVLSVAECSVCCMTFLPFPFFPCSFVWPKEPKAPGGERGLKPGYTSLRAASQTQSA